MKIRPVGTELFHADGRTERRTDVTNLILSFRNFANVPKNVKNNKANVTVVKLVDLCKPHLETASYHSLVRSALSYPNITGSTDVASHETCYFGMLQFTALLTDNQYKVIRCFLSHRVLQYY